MRDNFQIKEFLFYEFANKLVWFKACKRFIIYKGRCLLMKYV